MNGPGPDDAAGFAVWVRPHWPAMAGFARRLSSPADWEDVLQEALTASWRKRHQFDPARGNVRSWLLAIVADQAAKRWRRLRPVPELDRSARASEEPAHALDLDRAIRSLTHRQQLAINLYYYLGLPVAESAVVMGCTEGTVKSTLSAARGRLRELLGEDYR
jgi:RNA polymerase sigma-70 factor (ECF subfamily)